MTLSSKEDGRPLSRSSTSVGSNVLGPKETVTILDIECPGSYTLFLTQRTTLCGPSYSVRCRTDPLHPPRCTSPYPSLGLYPSPLQESGLYPYPDKGITLVVSDLKVLLIFGVSSCIKFKEIRGCRNMGF